MKSNEKKEIFDVSMEDRALLLLTGIVSFPVGFALYFYFKEKGAKNDYIKFSRMGAYVGMFMFIFILLALLFVYLYCLINSCF